MKKKLIAVLVAMATLLALISGCAQKAAPTEKNTTSTGTDVTETQGTASQEPEAERENVTLTILLHGGSTVSGVQDDPVTKAIQEKLGITLDVISTNGMDVTATLNALIASDDLPDIVVAVKQEQGQLLLDSDALLPLDDLVEQYGANIKQSESAQAAMSLTRQFSYQMEENYFIPVLTGENYTSGFPQVAPYIRWDIYEQIGAPAVENMDDLLNVLKQMQDAYPETENGKKVYAISGSLADGAWNNWSLTAIEAALGVRRVHTSGLAYTSTSDPSHLINGFEGDDAPVWRLFEFFNKAYQMGILDPEAATMKHDQFTEKIAAGQVLYTPFNAAGTLIENDPDKYFLPVPFEAYENDSFTCSYANSGGQFGYAISKSCEYPERAMELLDYEPNIQGSNLFPLFLGIVPQGRDQEVLQHLLKNLSDRDYHVTTGNQLTKYLFEVLRREGCHAEALQIATTETYPSIGYMLKNGATTIWERWENMTGNHMNSHDHPMLGAFTVWFYKALAGIADDAGLHNVVCLRPAVVPGLDYVTASCKTARGRLQSSWRWDGNRVIFEIQVPWNSKVRFVVPEGLSMENQQADMLEAGKHIVICQKVTT